MPSIHNRGIIKWQSRPSQNWHLLCCIVVEWTKIVTGLTYYMAFLWGHTGPFLTVSVTTMLQSCYNCWPKECRIVAWLYGLAFDCHLIDNRSWLNQDWMKIDTWVNHDWSCIESVLNDWMYQNFKRVLLHPPYYYYHRTPWATVHLCTSIVYWL